MFPAQLLDISRFQFDCGIKITRVWPINYREGCAFNSFGVEIHAPIGMPQVRREVKVLAHMLTDAVEIHDLHYTDGGPDDPDWAETTQTHTVWTTTFTTHWEDDEE